MATIAENIESMAVLVASVKKQTRLSEQTILRIVDMNFALAQNTGAPSFSGGEEFHSEEHEDSNQLVMFPELTEETTEETSDDK